MPCDSPETVVESQSPESASRLANSCQLILSEFRAWGLVGTATDE